jgi:hypothetical protein
VIAAAALVVCGAVVAWTLSLRGPSARAAFAGEADQLCDDYHRAVLELGSSGSLAGVPALVAREKPLAVGLRQQLELLEPPAGEARDYTGFLALVRRQIELLDAQRAAARAHDQGAFDRAAAASKRVHAAEGRLGKRLGFFVCGR